MNTRLTFLALAAITLAAVVPALAQAPTTLTVTGTVASSSPTSLVVQTPDGNKTFIVDDRSTIPATLARGQSVTITYETNASNQMRVVSVTPAEGEPQAGATTTGDTAERLPATASPLPLVAMLSAAALAAGWALRRRQA